MNARRGQAVVELAVASLVVVVVLIGGLHLAEIAFLSLKVQEASAAALWDATGRQVTDFTSSGDWTPFDSLPANVSDDLSLHYKNFDAVAFDGAHVSTPLQRLYTAASPMNVSCSEGLNMTPFGLPGGDGIANPVIAPYFSPRGWVQCTSSAVVSPVGLNNGWAPVNLNLCGAGGFGACNGASYSVLAGDWSVIGPEGSELNGQVPLPLIDRDHDETGVCGQAGTNRPYCNMVKSVFNAEKGVALPVAAAAQFAGTVGGPIASSLKPFRAPLDETAFAMSYVGAEGTEEDQYFPFLDDLKAGPDKENADRTRSKDCNICHFNTAGTSSVTGEPGDPVLGSVAGVTFYNDYKSYRVSCFLGLTGPGCTGTPVFNGWY